MPSVKPVQVPNHLTQALTRAGDKNGVDFDYLLQTAIRESSLDPHAKAKTSSAVGLFQFIEGTWLEVLKEEGPKLGYGSISDKIARTDDGYAVKDPKMRNGILALRENPEMSADLAAAFTRRNGAYLHEKFGRMPSPGELYIAHFMGARGAERFFNLGLSSPNANAVKHFPAQARANEAIFYDKGKPRTIKQVYQVLVAKHRALGVEAPGTQTAAFAAQQMATSNQGPFSVSQTQGPASPFAMLYRAAPSVEIQSRVGAGATAVPTSQPAELSQEEIDARRQSFFSRFYSK